jgi:ribosomal protein S18 acetylase RimI-like enzyme
MSLVTFSIKDRDMSDDNNSWIKYATLIGLGLVGAYGSYRYLHPKDKRDNTLRKNPKELYNVALGKVSIKFPAKIPKDMLMDADESDFILGMAKHKRSSLKRCGIYYSVNGIDKQIVGFIIPREVDHDKWTIDAIYVDPEFRDKDIASQALILFFANREAAEVHLDVNDSVAHQVFGKAGFVHNPKIYFNELSGLRYNKWNRNPYIAVIIKESPQFTEGRQKKLADDFYNRIIEVLDIRGYSVVFDDGSFNEPLPNASLWIAHGNGEDKLHEALKTDNNPDRDVIFISDYSDFSAEYQAQLEQAAKERRIRIHQLDTINRPIPKDRHFELTNDLKGTLNSL